MAETAPETVANPSRSKADSAQTTPPGGATNNVRVLEDLVRGFELGHSAEQAGQFLELADWWLATARNEIERTVPKAVEYGSGDLVEIGRTLATCMGRTVGNEQAAELGVYFYLVGKMARWTDAVKRGDRPSDDTLFDLGVYVRMAQRIRAAGGWPGGQS